MNDNNVEKMQCSADEYAHLQNSYNQYVNLATRLKEAKPGTFRAEILPKYEYLIAMFAEALNVFEVRAGSQRTDKIVLSPEFQENFAKLKTPPLEFTGIVVEN